MNAISLQVASLSHTKFTGIFRTLLLLLDFHNVISTLFCFVRLRLCLNPNNIKNRFFILWNGNRLITRKCCYCYETLKGGLWSENFASSAATFVCVFSLTTWNYFIMFYIVAETVLEFFILIGAMMMGRGKNIRITI